MEIYASNDRICITEITEGDKQNCLVAQNGEHTAEEEENNRKLALLIAQMEGTEAERINERAEQLLEEVALKLIIAETTFNGIIRLVNSNEFVGRVCLLNLTSPLPELGIDILPQFWRKGYASEAVPMFLKVCKERFNVSRIKVRISKDNLPSIRLFEKLGAISYEEEPLLSDEALDLLHNKLRNVIDLASMEEKTILSYCLNI